jgi:hypothetical protein
MASAFDFPAEEANEPWHIDPKDKDPRSEDDRQAAVLRLRRQLCPAIDIIAVPNAGRRSAWEARKRLREGMKAGALDLVATWQPSHAGDRGVAFIEMKDGRAMPDGNQVDRLNMLYRWGHHCGVFRQEMSVMRWLQGLGAPFMRGVRL